MLGAGGMDMKASQPLHKIYSWIFLLVSLLLIGIVITVAGWLSSQNLREESGKSLMATAVTMGEQLDQNMWARYGEVEILTQLAPFRTPTDLNRTRELITQFKETFPMFSWIGLTDSAGTVIASTDKILEGKSIAERPVYLEAQGKPFIGDVHEAVLLAELLPNPSGEVMEFVDISLPLNSELPSPVLATHLSWEWARGVEQQVMAPLEADEGIELFVVSARDETILLGPDQWIGKVTPVEIREMMQATPTWGEASWSSEGDFVTAAVKSDGYLDYDGLGWIIIARQPTDIAFAPANELVKNLILIGLLLVLLSGVLGSFLANRLMRPVRQLSRAAVELQTGERMNIPVQRGIAEFELLSITLNGMIESLRDTRNQLDRMELVAMNDYLTGLPNRRALEEYTSKPFTDIRHLFYMDLDGFKTINDTLGHQAGDDLLIELALRVQQGLEDGEFMARIGGDEFIFITQGSQSEAEQRARYLMSKITKPYILEEQEAVIGVSVGGIELKSGVSLEDSIALADEALYSVKKSGKNDVRFFN